MKHTPGPWTTAEGPTYCAIRTDGRVIADMRLVGLHYNKADAALIAAAPELLAALKAIKERLEKSPTHVMYASEVFDSFYLSLINETIDKAEAA